MDFRKARPAIIGAAALYLLYIAYELFEGRSNPETDMSLPLRYVFIGFFVLAAAALVVYAYRLWAAQRRQDREGQEKPPEDENSIKS